MGDKAAAAAKSERMKGCLPSLSPFMVSLLAGDKLGQRQPQAKSRRETSLGDKVAAAAKSEIMKETSLGDKAAAAAKEKS